MARRIYASPDEVPDDVWNSPATITPLDDGTLAVDDPEPEPDGTRYAVLADADRTAAAPRVAGQRALAAENQRAARDLHAEPCGAMANASAAIPTACARPAGHDGAHR